MGRDRFISITSSLLYDMVILSPNAYRLFILLLNRITRKNNREPTEESNSFGLTYLDFMEHGISRSSYNRGITELCKKGFIKTVGTRTKKVCFLLKW